MVVDVVFVVVVVVLNVNATVWVVGWGGLQTHFHVKPNSVELS